MKERGRGSALAEKIQKRQRGNALCRKSEPTQVAAPCHQNERRRGRERKEKG